MAFTGAGTFVYSASFPLVDSPLVCCPTLMRLSGLDARILIDVLPLFVPVAATAAAIGLVIASAVGVSLARGALLSVGLVGMALILHDAGGLIDIKGGTLAAGALLGFGGASLILAASVFAHSTGDFQENRRQLTGPLRVIGPVAILLGAGMFVVALVMPWTTRPFPLRLVSLPPVSEYWMWSIAVPSAIILPVAVAGVRMLTKQHRRQPGLGMALAGGIFATLLFVQVVGRVVLSSSAGLPGLPPMFVLEAGAYVGLASGALIIAGAATYAFSLRRRQESSA